MGEPEGKRLFGGPRRRWEDTTKLDLQEIGGSFVDGIRLPHGRNRWWASCCISCILCCVFSNSAGLHIGRASTFVFRWSQKCVQPALICTTQPFPLTHFSDASLWSVWKAVCSVLWKEANSRPRCRGLGCTVTVLTETCCGCCWGFVPKVTYLHVPSYRGSWLSALALSPVRWQHWWWE